MPVFTPGRFVGHENYCTDDFQPYAAGSISLLDQPGSLGTISFSTGTFYFAGHNYAADDFEMEIPGHISNLMHGQRNGDSLFKKGRLR
jgi:hypothetical protein